MAATQTSAALSRDSRRTDGGPFPARFNSLVTERADAPSRRETTSPQTDAPVVVKALFVGEFGQIRQLL